jgi:hypothetical protein
MALTLDRKAFINVLSEGQADIGAAMLPPPEGLWGMPPERLRATTPTCRKAVPKRAGSCSGSATA